MRPSASTVSPRPNVGRARSSGRSACSRLLRRIGGERDGRHQFAPPRSRSTIRSVFVWLNSTPSRNGRALCVPNGIVAYRWRRGSVHAPQRGQLRAAGEDRAVVHPHVVHVAGVPARRASRCRPGRRCGATGGTFSLQRATELPGVRVPHAPTARERLGAQVVLEHGVEPGRGQVEHVAVHEDLVTHVQVGVAERSLAREPAVVHEDLVARRQVDQPVVERDAPEPAIAPPPLPVDVGIRPVEDLLGRAGLQVHQVEAAVALALMHGADHRAAEDAGEGEEVTGSRLSWCPSRVRPSRASASQAGQVRVPHRPELRRQGGVAGREELLQARAAWPAPSAPARVGG